MASSVNMIRVVLSDVYKDYYSSARVQELARKTDAIEARIRSYADFVATPRMWTAKFNTRPRTGTVYADPWKRLAQVESDIKAAQHPEWGETGL